MILRLHKIRKCLGLLERGVISFVAMPMTMIAMTMRMWNVRRAYILHLIDIAALGTAFYGAVSGNRKPDGDVRFGGVAGAAAVLLVAEGFYDDGVVNGSCFSR